MNPKTKKMLATVKSHAGEILRLITLAEYDSNEAQIDICVEEIMKLNEQIDHQISTNWH